MKTKKTEVVDYVEEPGHPFFWPRGSKKGKNRRIFKRITRADQCIATLHWNKSLM